jgi:hypothetical protein
VSQTSVCRGTSLRFRPDQIDLIKKWISRGLKTTIMTRHLVYAIQSSVPVTGIFVKPMIQSKCTGAHSGSNPQASIRLTTYFERFALMLYEGSLYNSVVDGWMPLGGSRLDDMLSGRTSGMGSSGST